MSDSDKKKSTAEQYREIRKQRAERVKTKEEAAKKKKRQFWDKQPVPQDENERSSYRKPEPIEIKTVDDVPKTPLPLPKGYEWYEFDVHNDEEMNEIFTLLEENYVEDDDCTFRFAYPVEFLRWALTPPGWTRNLHVAVRCQLPSGKYKFVALITGVPCLINSFEKKIPMVEINFLCVYRKLRGKNLAAKLISEITRRVNCGNVWQAIYTAGRYLPTPLTTTKYYHRSLNPRKLVGIKFSSIPKRLRKYDNAIERMERLYHVSDEVRLKDPSKKWRRMTAEDAPKMVDKFNTFMKTRFKMFQVYDEKEFLHWMGNREGVISSFVVEDDKGEISDFVCYYHLPSTIIKHKKYKVLKAAYLFYYYYTDTPLNKLVDYALIEAKKEEMDVFNCLNILENERFLTELKFNVGDGCLYYYFYNFKCPKLKNDDVGITML